MDSVKMVSCTDENGCLNVSVPVRIKNKRVEVLLIWQEVEATDDASADENARISKREALHELFGSLGDDPLERPDQGKIELREPVR